MQIAEKIVTGNALEFEVIFMYLLILSVIPLSTD